MKKQKLPIWQKLANFMSDKKWHSNKELNKVAGWRFGWYLFILKEKGYIFEKKGKNEWDLDYIEYWKLIKAPNLIKKPKNLPIEVYKLEKGKVLLTKHSNFNDLNRFLYNLTSKIWK